MKKKTHEIVEESECFSVHNNGRLQLTEKKTRHVPT